MNQDKPNQLQLTDEQLARIERSKARREGAKISPEWGFVARFGKFYGWQGVMAILNNEIDLETAIMLMRGADSVRASEVIDFANASYIAGIASRSKKGSSIMKKGLKNYIQDAKAVG